MICTVPFSRTETQQLVVPRSIPITLLMCRSSFYCFGERIWQPGSWSSLLRYFPASLNRKSVDVFEFNILADIGFSHVASINRRNFRRRFLVPRPLDLRPRTDDGFIRFIGRFAGRHWLERYRFVFRGRL